MKIIVGYVSNSFIVVHDKSHFSSVDIFEINIYIIYDTYMYTLHITRIHKMWYIIPQW